MKQFVLILILIIGYLAFAKSGNSSISHEHNTSLISAALNKNVDVNDYESKTSAFSLLTNKPIQFIENSNISNLYSRLGEKFARVYNNIYSKTVLSLKNIILKLSSLTTIYSNKLLIEFNSVSLYNLFNWSDIFTYRIHRITI